MLKICSATFRNMQRYFWIVRASTFEKCKIMFESIGNAEDCVRTSAKDISPKMRKCFPIRDKYCKIKFGKMLKVARASVKEVCPKMQNHFLIVTQMSAMGSEKCWRFFLQTRKWGCPKMQKYCSGHWECQSGDFAQNAESTLQNCKNICSVSSSSNFRKMQKYFANKCKNIVQSIERIRGVISKKCWIDFAKLQKYVFSVIDFKL